MHSRRGGAGCLRHPLVPPFLHFQNQEGRRDWPGPSRGRGEPHICKAGRRLGTCLLPSFPEAKPALPGLGVVLPKAWTQAARSKGKNHTGSLGAVAGNQSVHLNKGNVSPVAPPSFSVFF